jgi:hypothetical protein
MDKRAQVAVEKGLQVPRERAIVWLVEAMRTTGWSFYINALRELKAPEALPALAETFREHGNSDAVKAILETNGEVGERYLLDAVRRAPRERQADLVRTIWRTESPEAARIARRCWWRLRPQERRKTFRDWWDHPHWEMELHHLFHERLERQLGRDMSYEELIERSARLLSAAAPWPWFPMGGVGVLAELMALRVDRAPVFRERNTLRFRFLAEHAVGREGEPFAHVFEQVTEGQDMRWLRLERLMDMEGDADERLSRIAAMRATMRELLEREADLLLQRPEAEGAPEGSPELQEVREEIASLGERIGSEEQELENPEGHLRQLEQATERLLPPLLERGMRLRVIPVEGVLGEYDFADVAVTLYPPMIQLAAADLFRRHQDRWREVDALVADLSTVVEIHEHAHAASHLGKNANGQTWSLFPQAPKAWHETIAQCYTDALLRQIDGPDLQAAFESLLDKQPEEYRHWLAIRDCPSEAVRSYLLLGRLSEARDLLDFTEAVLRFLSANAPMLTQQWGPAWPLIVKAAQRAQEEMGTAQSASQVVECCDRFLDTCQSLPVLHEMLNAVTVGGMPDETERAFMRLKALFGAEPAVPTGTTLRAVSLPTPGRVRPLAPELRERPNRLELAFGSVMTAAMRTETPVRPGQPSAPKQEPTAKNKSDRRR